MSEIANCVYCGNPVDPSKPYWILERWENGRCVARGAITNAGCLIATAHSQRPRDPGLGADYEGLAPTRNRLAGDRSCGACGTRSARAPER